MKNIALLGSTGRMGLSIQKVCETLSDILLTPIGRLDSLKIAPDSIDVLIDFSSPAGLMDALKFCTTHRIALVSGTTGLDNKQRAQCLLCSKTIPLVQAANFSVGVHLLAKAVALTSRATLSQPDEDNWDIEIFEAHHRHKVDAPGGTALFLGQTAAEGRNLVFDEVATFSREGIIEQRKDSEIGYQVLRGGSIVGTHTVSFCTEGELIELSHKALDRSIFARGAIRSARWIKGKPPGLYGMEDVLFS